MTGGKYLNKSSVRSATRKGYVLDAARLFTLRGYQSPVNFFLIQGVGPESFVGP